MQLTARGRGNRGCGGSRSAWQVGARRFGPSVGDRRRARPEQRGNPCYRSADSAPIPTSGIPEDVFGGNRRVGPRGRVESSYVDGEVQDFSVAGFRAPPRLGPIRNSGIPGDTFGGIGESDLGAPPRRHASPRVPSAAFLETRGRWHSRSLRLLHLEPSWAGGNATYSARRRKSSCGAPEAPGRSARGLGCHPLGPIEKPAAQVAQRGCSRIDPTGADA